MITRSILKFYYESKRKATAAWWRLVLPSGTHYYVQDDQHFLCFSSVDGSYYWSNYRAAKDLGRLSKETALQLYREGYGSGLMMGLMLPSLSDHLMMILNPLFWFQSDNFCSEWDTSLRELLLSRRFVRRSDTTVKIGQNLVWVANHPYGSFARCVGDEMVRPKRSTIALANRVLRIN